MSLFYPPLKTIVVWFWQQIRTLFTRYRILVLVISVFFLLVSLKEATDGGFFLLFDENDTPEHFLGP